MTQTRLKSELLSETPAKPRPTITDVAQEAGVSRTAVSYVLSSRMGTRVPEVTRRRIFEAAERVGYRRNALAAAFRSGRMNTVGIVCPASVLSASSEQTGNIHYRDLVLALASAGFEAGLNPLLLSEDASRQISLGDITDRRADGVILVVKDHAENFVQEALAAGVPCVTIGREHGAWQVHTDSFLGARLAVNHLLDLGHRRLAYFWHGKTFVPSARLRREGFYATLEPVQGAVGSDFTDSDEGIAALMSALARADGPTAIFCYNDEMASQLLDRCRAAGLRVPEDLSLVGFDNNLIAFTTWPRLTTVESPLLAVARTAVELLLSQMRGEVPPSAPVFVAPSLVVRESSGPPPPG
ncbi:MAG: LacI family DNA-binding transcriptional regulator [Cytophagales bacterium]|nr:LacI family DNA-binding transcriptional regulator [Armatimonadota bacterium]